MWKDVTCVEKPGKLSLFTEISIQSLYLLPFYTAGHLAKI